MKDGVAQHFLLSAKARSLDLFAVMRMTEDQARDAFRAVRFADTEGDPVCPKCACPAVWEFNSRHVFKCKRCEHQFTLTSGTVFARRKMFFQKILAAIAYFVMPAQGLSAIELSHKLDISYKTAWVLAHKLREVMVSDADPTPLKDVVEIDGAEFGGYIKPKNVAKRRIDKRKVMYRSSKKKIVVVARERGGRAKVAVFKSETEAKDFIIKNVAKGTSIHADKERGWNDLRGKFKMYRIDHTQAYWTPEACTNGAENFFSVLRRVERGVYHHIADRYLVSYAEEVAWRQNNRNEGSGERYRRLMGAAAKQAKSDFVGYWQRRKAQSGNLA